MWRPCQEACTGGGTWRAGVRERLRSAPAPAAGMPARHPVAPCGLMSRSGGWGALQVVQGSDVCQLVFHIVAVWHCDYQSCVRLIRCITSSGFCAVIGRQVVPAAKLARGGDPGACGAAPASSCCGGMNCRRRLFVAARCGAAASASTMGLQAAGFASAKEHARQTLPHQPYSQA